MQATTNMSQTASPEFLNSRLVNFSPEKITILGGNKLGVIRGIINALDFLSLETDPETKHNPWVFVEISEGNFGNVRLKTLANWFGRRENGEEWTEIMSGYKGRGISIKEVDVSLLEDI